MNANEYPNCAEDKILTVENLDTFINIIKGKHKKLSI